MRDLPCFLTCGSRVCGSAERLSPTSRPLLSSPRSEETPIVYNVGPLQTLSEEEWVRAIARAHGWTGDIVVAPERSECPKCCARRSQSIKM